MNRILVALSLLAAFMLTGCSKSVPYDYTAFKESKPKSILVLPAVNESLEVKAGHSLVSQVTYPLAESGYYVFPVAVVEETLQQNGVTVAQDAQNISYKKLHEIFGADSALYLDIEEYGTQYQIINSDTRVTASAKLVDLRSGKHLWNGRAVASSTENDSNSNGNLVGILVSAVISQIANTITDKGHEIAGITSYRLLTAGGRRGLLYGPRSEHYGKEEHLTAN